jgi:hypothetical protein
VLSEGSISITLTEKVVKGESQHGAQKSVFYLVRTLIASGEHMREISLCIFFDKVRYTCKNSNIIDVREGAVGRSSSVLSTMLSGLFDPISVDPTSSVN